MKSLARIGFGAALGLVALACSGSTLGSAGTGGTGGGATGGQGGAVVTTPLELPSCLQDLLASCAPQGACVAATAPAGWGEFCFDSGVRASASTMDAPGLCGNTKSVVRVNKPDGTLCYTLESFVEETCQFQWYLWRDGAGNPVAQGVAGADPNWSVTVSCNGTNEITHCDGPRPIAYPPPGCCNLSQFGDAVCAGGAPMGACASGTCP